MSRPSLEVLESRINPTEIAPAAPVMAAVTGGLLTVVGTQGDDDVTMTKNADNIVVSAAGQVLLTTPADGVTFISVDLMAGADKLVVADLGHQNAIIWVSAGAGSDTVTCADPATIDGGDDNDTLYGSGRDDVIWGGGGRNYIRGYSGNDLLIGGDGVGGIGDKIDGGAGDDTIYGGAAADKLWGGQDSDVIYGYGGNDTISTYFFADEDEVLIVRPVDFANDYVYGGDGDDILWAHGTAAAFGGFIIMDGGAGDDTINAADLNRSFLYGRDGNDVIYSGYGSARVNTIDGGTGEDWIAASLGDVVADDPLDLVVRG